MRTDAARERLAPVADGIHRFDTHYIRPRHTNVHIVTAGDDTALIDTGVAANVEALLAALDELGIALDEIGHVLLTHAHLDHAGAAGRLMRELPNARLYAHPSAAKHMIDPTKLEAGVRQVYGDEFFDREYGELVPVPAGRVVETPDGERVRVGDRVLEMVYTPGHAWHHQCIWEPETRTLFTGDAFGIHYPELDGPKGPFVVPETPPPQFAHEEMHASLDRIVACEPARVAPTHFGVIEDVAGVADDLRRLLDWSVERCWQAASQEGLAEDLLAGWARDLERRGRGDEIERMRELYAMDAGLAAQGLWLWRQKQGR